jgi:hypothetical protein
MEAASPLAEVLQDVATEVLRSDRQQQLMKFAIKLADREAGLEGGKLVATVLELHVAGWRQLLDSWDNAWDNALHMRRLAVCLSLFLTMVHGPLADVLTGEVRVTQEAFVKVSGQDDFLGGMIARNLHTFYIPPLVAKTTAAGMTGALFLAKHASMLEALCQPPPKMFFPNEQVMITMADAALTGEKQCPEPVEYYRHTTVACKWKPYMYWIQNVLGAPVLHGLLQEPVSASSFSGIVALLQPVPLLAAEVCFACDSRVSLSTFPLMLQYLKLLCRKNKNEEIYKVFAQQVARVHLWAECPPPLLTEKDPLLTMLDRLGATEVASQYRHALESTVTDSVRSWLRSLGISEDFS